MGIRSICLGFVLCSGVLAACGDDPAREQATAVPTAATSGPDVTATVLPTSCDPTPPTFANGDLPTFAFGAHDGHLWITAADGTDAHTLTPEPIGGWAGAAAGDASWSPDGETLAYGDQSNALVLLNIDSNTTSSIPNVFSDGSGTFLAWAPDSKSLAFRKAHDGSRLDFDLWITDMSGDARLVVEYGDPIDWSPDGTTILYRVDAPPPDPANVSPPPALPDGPAPDTIGSEMALLDVATSRTESITRNGFWPFGKSQSPWSPDGSFVAYWRDVPGRQPETGVRQTATLVAFNLASRTETLLPDTPFDLTDTLAAWAPVAGSNILYNRRLDPVTSEVTVAFPEPLAILSWAESRETVAVVREVSPDTRDLVLMDLESGIENAIATREVLPGDDDFHFPGFAALLNPNGTRIAFTSLIDAAGASPGTLFLREVDGSEHTLLSGLPFRSGLVEFSADGESLLVQRAGGATEPVSICAATAPDWLPGHVADGFLLGSDVSASWRPSPRN
jgi:Tol biopolymer transport system component